MVSFRLDTGMSFSSSKTFDLHLGLNLGLGLVLGLGLGGTEKNACNATEISSETPPLFL